jgi:hypothetical protein
MGRAEAPHLSAGVEVVTGSLRDAVERIAEIARQTPAEKPHSDIPLAPTVRIA